MALASALFFKNSGSHISEVGACGTIQISFIVMRGLFEFIV